MKYFFLFLILLFIPSLCWGYGYQHVDCGCGSSFVNKKVDVKLLLDNSGGMNIFYVSSDSQQLDLNLYSTVSNKSVTISGNADSSGNVGVDISSNYSGAFVASFVSCSGVSSQLDAGFLQMISLIVGAIAAVSLVLGSTLRW